MHIIINAARGWISRGLLVSMLAVPGAAGAQIAELENGWTLDPQTSRLQFQSIKNQTKVESSTFATYTGFIEPDGSATVRILLDSVDTKVDLRNVRMRFLLFETFLHPEAVVNLQVTESMLGDLAQVRRKVINVPFTISLHGITKAYQADVAVTLLSDDSVSVSSAMPISLATSEFGLDEGVRKLEEAANVKIVPSATVTFDFVFNRDVTGETMTVARATPEVPEARATSEMPQAQIIPAAVALEAEGNFSQEACVGRFEILSRTGNINFAKSSAALDDSSTPLLDSIADIIGRCPDLDIMIAGHTDSDGSAARNQVLSEQRAAVVVQYMVRQGIEASRLRSAGYGEMQPAYPNDTPGNKRRNRRIEFSVVN